MIRIYIGLWLVICVFLSYEYYSMNFGKTKSVLVSLESKNLIKSKMSTEPGRSLSLWLGWAGLGLMVVMNIYSMRKRIKFMHKMGPLIEWLNFHIFCGLVGPTFIVFHCNFKVRGLVGISFWSMVVSFSSGVIGRYFYLQLTGRKQDYIEGAEQWKNRLKLILEKFDVKWDEKEAAYYLATAVHFVGGPVGKEAIPNPAIAFIHSFIGDIRLMFKAPERHPTWPALSSEVLKEYAVLTRRASLLEGFQKLMGYWHAFHFPFGVFMYLAAAIHVTAALVLGV